MTLRTPPDLQHVTCLLIKWGCWVRSSRYGRGYPPHSWEGRAQERGGAAPDPSPRPLPDYPDEERIERLVLLMPEWMRAVVQEHYVAGGTIKDKCKDLRVGRATYYERLTKAKIWLKPRVEQKERPADFSQAG